jgi:putative molybdopterin biosynthesis protein
MDGPRVHSRLKERRLKAGLQQRELAERVGVSRQTLGALEAGESVPATSIALQLARALGCRVEDLFWLGDEERPLEVALVGPSAERAAADRGQGRRVAVAAVDERWVAHLLDGEGAPAFAVPADGILAPPGGRERGGKRPAGPLRVRPLRDGQSLRENLFAAGCDPALALLAAHVGERWQGGRVHWVEAGSGAALDMMAAHQVHLAGVHLLDEDSGEYNVAPVRRRLGGRAVALINLAVWEQGLLVAAGNPKKIRRVADVARKGVRVVGRESGSGSQELFGRLAAEEGVPRRAIDVVAVARGHMAVAQAIAAGGADTGIATRAAAAAHGLEFIPLAEARFDLVMPRQSSGDERVERLLDVLRGERFRRDLGGLAGYGTARTGQVVAEVAA